MIVSRFVSSHASRARLHVNARTHRLRRTMRQARSVVRGPLRMSAYRLDRGEVMALDESTIR